MHLFGEEHWYLKPSTPTELAKQGVPAARPTERTRTSPGLAAIELYVWSLFHPSLPPTAISAVWTQLSSRLQAAAASRYASRAITKPGKFVLESQRPLARGLPYNSSLTKAVARQRQLSTSERAELLLSIFADCNVPDFGPQNDTSRLAHMHACCHRFYHTAQIILTGSTFI